VQTPASEEVSKSANATYDLKSAQAAQKDHRKVTDHSGRDSEHPKRDKQYNYREHQQRDDGGNRHHDGYDGYK